MVESKTCTIRVNTPLVAGMPNKTPFAERDNPGGEGGEFVVSDLEYGGAPPLA